MCHTGHMSREPAAATEVRKAIAARDRLKERHDAAVKAVHVAVLAALDSGITQAELTRITGFSREHIRQITIARRLSGDDDQK